MIATFWSRFDEELSRCTVRVLAVNSKGSSFGTGFFVAPGQIMTCAHVVGSEAATDIRIEWRGNEYKVKVRQLVPNPVPTNDVYPDLAILKVAIKDHPVVVLDEAVRITDVLYTFGYSDFQPHGVGTTAAMDGDARYGESGDHRLLKFKNGQFRPGLSGSPLLNTRTERVCGILKTSRDENSDLGGEGITVSTLYWHFGYLREGNSTGRGLILSGPNRERDVMKVVQRVHEMDDDDDGWVEELVYCAMPPLESRSAANHYATIVEQCQKRGFVALQLYDFPTYRSRTLDTVQQLIWRANLVIFDLTEEHPDVLYQLGYQDGIEVDDEAVLLVKQLPERLNLNFPPFEVKLFSDERKLSEIVSDRLDQLAEKREERERAAERRRSARRSKQSQAGRRVQERKAQKSKQ
jgi:Trypsin-like peptidase domain